MHTAAYSVTIIILNVNKMNGDDDKRGENREMTREKGGRSKNLLLLPPDDGGDGESGGDNVRRLAYRKRLETFSAATYFAKPAELSPIVCARFGYVLQLFYSNDKILS